MPANGGKNHQIRRRHARLRARNRSSANPPAPAIARLPIALVIGGRGAGLEGWAHVWPQSGVLSALSSVDPGPRDHLITEQLERELRAIAPDLRVIAGLDPAEA